ncbi:glycosyltransferase [Protaetiibacter larvae]|nr:glycosyltransferase [Protaetiibacter larvae]
MRHEESPWRYGLAREWFEVDFSVDHPESRIGRFCRKALRRVVGFDLVHVLRNRGLIRSAQVVWAHTEREHLAVALLKLISRPPFPVIIAQSVWLYDEWSSYGRLRRAAYRKLLSQLAAETLHTDEGVERARAIDASRVVVRLPFGSSYSASTERDDHGGHDTEQRGARYVLSVGNDRHRDWATLVTAARMLPATEFRVACDPAKFPRVGIPENVSVGRVKRMSELKALYRGADAVVLPLAPNTHASGVTVAMEAVLENVPLVTSDVGGLRAYLPDAGVAYFPVGDVDALVRRLGELSSLPRALAPKGGEAFARERGLLAVDYVRRHVHLTRAVLAGREPPPLVSAFAHVPAPEVGAPR